MKRLIINADDFGKNVTIIDSILLALNQGLCRDTTILTNFEESEAGIKLLLKEGFKDSAGVHLNLTDGKPLSNLIKSEPRFCNSAGEFIYKRQNRIYYLTSSEKKAILLELKRQIQFCKKLNIKLTHADSHNHIHEEPGLLKLILSLLREEQIPFLRILNNLGKTSNFNMCYRFSMNTILKCARMNGTDFFGNTIEFSSSHRDLKSSIIEIMIHPGLIKDNAVYDIYLNENLSIILPKILDGNQLISYNQLKKQDETSPNCHFCL
jgi:chitin disaccharide deacetylase